MASARPSSTYLFTWKHGKALVQIPVKLKPTVDRSSGISGKLICPICATKKKPVASYVKQKYHCDCGFEGTVKDVTHRYDEEDQVIFTNDEKNAFMEQKVEKVITVVKEIPLVEAFLNLEFMDTSGLQEMYSNESTLAINVMVDTHGWLMRHHTALLVQYGQRGKNRTGYLIASKDRIDLFELNSYTAIHNPLQQGITPVKTTMVEFLRANTENIEQKIHRNFMDAKKNGVKFEVVEKVQEKPIITEVPSFLGE